MPPLPPLRTAREAAAAKAEANSTPNPALSPGMFRTSVAAETPVNTLAGPANAPIQLRQLLGELRRNDMIDAVDIDTFVKNVGPKLLQLNDKDRAAAAMEQHGLITAFQAERLLHGNTFGLVFGNYRVRERLNGGSVGTVFRAEHKILKRNVAIKVVSTDDSVPSQFLERFDLEMELLARIDHPHVVRILDTGTLIPTESGLNPLKYAVLEYVAGGDLENFVYANGIVAPGLACEWGRQLATGLAASHAHNLVHRDFKPSNVLLTADRRAKITDLGLTRHFGSISTPRPGIVGSIEFMSPEQVADAGTVGPPADVYALGATLFWILTGQLPYEKAANSKAALQQIRDGVPRRLHDVDENLPGELNDLLARLMNRNPAARPTALEAATLLAAFADPTPHPALDGLPFPAEADSQLGLLRFAVNHLEDTLAARNAMQKDSADAVLTTLARVAQFRGESAGLQKRIQEYVKAMARKIHTKPDWVMFSDPAIVDDVLKAIPARNVGLVGVPDHILTNEGELRHEEQLALERHPLIGCNILDVIVARHGKALPFARIARDVIRSHHEKWDGSGFPDRLRKESIPHSARLVAIAEAYDALRQPLGSEPGLTHEQAVEGLVNDSKGFFDPNVIDALVAAHDTIANVFASVPD
ncbi:hypothetical protein BH11PLA2_BH11PLA2_07910 [soil metagenome]